MKFLKGLDDMAIWTYTQKTLTFLWKFLVRDLDPKVTPGVEMVLIKT